MIIDKKARERKEGIHKVGVIVYCFDLNGDARLISGGRGKPFFFSKKYSAPAPPPHASKYLGSMF